MPVNKWICPRESGYNLFMSIQLNQDEELDPSQWVHRNYVILSVSWINLSDGDLDILIAWIFQLKIWSRGVSVLIWLIWKCDPFWCSSVRGSSCSGSTLLCELTTSTCQIQPGGCSLPQELTDVPDEECLWQHVSYKKKTKKKEKRKFLGKH